MLPVPPRPAAGLFELPGGQLLVKYLPCPHNFVTMLLIPRSDMMPGDITVMREKVTRALHHALNYKDQAAKTSNTRFHDMEFWLEWEEDGSNEFSIQFDRMPNDEVIGVYSMASEHVHEFKITSEKEAKVQVRCDCKHLIRHYPSPGIWERPLIAETTAIVMKLIPKEPGTTRRIVLGAYQASLSDAGPNTEWVLKNRTTTKPELIDPW